MLLTLVSAVLASPLTCRDLQEMTAAHLAESSVVEVVTDAGMLSTDMPCVEALALPSVVLEAARLHLVDPPPPPPPVVEQFAAPTEPTPVIGLRALDVALNQRLSEHQIRTRRAGTAFTITGVATAVVGGVLLGAGLGGSHASAMDGDPDGVQRGVIVAGAGGAFLLIGVSWTGAGIAIGASAGE